MPRLAPSASLVAAQRMMQGGAQRREATSARGSNTTGLPDLLKAGVERLSGVSLDDVKVHYNSRKPAQLQALAYTQGAEIHVAPGQERHLPHEAWHVVQQLQGRVRANAQLKGMGLNDEPGLEREADAMGARAARWSGPDERTRGAGEGSGRGVSAGDPPGTSGAPVQRNVGMELETQSGWRVTSGGKKVDKGTPIIARPYFELQAEFSSDDASNLEFVTNPPGLKDRKEYTAFKEGLLRLRAELNVRAHGEPFAAKELAGGKDGYVIHPGGAKLNPFLQVTAGVPLASVGPLFRNLHKIGAQGISYEDSADEGESLAKEFADGSEESRLNGGPSQTLVGLVSLIRRYLVEGTIGATRTFPKGVFSVMARTDFKKMFSMLPEEEREFIAKNMDRWVSTMTKDLTTSQGKGPEYSPVLGQVFDDVEAKEMPAVKITTSREAWLKTMPTHDLLTYEGVTKAEKDAVQIMNEKSTVDKVDGLRPVKEYTAKTDGPVKDELLKDIYLGLGAMGDKVDKIEGYGEQKAKTEATIVELRQPPQMRDDWVLTMDQMFDAVDDAIRHPKGVPEEEMKRRAQDEPTEKERLKGLEKEFEAAARKDHSERLRTELRERRRAEENRERILKERYNLSPGPRARRPRVKDRIGHPILLAIRELLRLPGS